MPSDTVAQQVATRDESLRVAELQDALSRMRKLAQPLEPPDPVLVIDHKLIQLDVVYQRDWQEYQREAVTVYVDSTATLQDARVASVRAAEAKVGHPL